MKQNNITFERDTFKLSLLEGAELVGYYGFPKLKPNNIIDNVYALPFNYMLSTSSPERYYLHFYIDDYQFERVWDKPHLYTALLKQFKGVFAPDFSLYLDMPKIYQIWNCYRSRALAYYWQQNGINIIPNVTWSDEESFNWCFDGLPENSAVAVSSLGCMKNARSRLNFCKGYVEMCKRLKPTLIYFYGTIPESLKDDKRIIHIETYTQIKFNLKEI